MLAGADYPPPAGSLWLVLLIIILDIIQDRYLRWLGEKLLVRKTFLLNELLFCIAGIVVAVGMILCNGGFRKETGVWVGIITAVCDIWNSILGNQSNRGRCNRKKETVESDLSLCFPATLKRFALQMGKRF